MDRHPGRAAGGVEQRIQQRPVRHRIGAVAHRFGLAVRTGDRAGIQVIAADDDRRLELATRHHLVERQPESVPVTQAHPADARRQALELDALARQGQPVMQVRVIGQ